MEDIVSHLTLSVDFYGEQIVAQPKGGESLSKLPEIRHQLIHISICNYYKSPGSA
jgi:hypothetical protein